MQKFVIVWGRSQQRDGQKDWPGGSDYPKSNLEKK